MNMKIILSFLASFCILETGVAQEQASVDQTVAASAQQAVQKLGKEMMKGNFTFGHQRMYPRWKRRLAKRYDDSMEKLDSALAAAARQKIKMRFDVIGYRAARPTKFFKVWPVKRINPETRRPITEKRPRLDPVTKQRILDKEGNPIIVEQFVYDYHLLAVVPTITRVQLPDKQRGNKMVTAEENGYVLVVSKEGVNDWHFLTGLKPSVQDLRSLFPTLPRELGLPKPSAREIK